MKTKVLTLLLCLGFISVFAQEEKEVDEFQLYVVDKNAVVKKAGEKATQAWKNERFGMFIHWGPISQMGKQLSHSRNSPSHRTGQPNYKNAVIEPAVYDVQYKTFNPVNYDPDYIVGLAKRAGMSYLVFTAKHHAGFSMFDSKHSDYDIMSTPYGKDVLKELEQACRKQNFNVGFYYSPRDWYHPDCDSEHNHDRYIQFYKAQMEELLNNYGPIHEIWFDGLGPGKWGSTSSNVMKRIRELHPTALVNDRGGVGADFYTPEHTVGYYNNKHPWEACHTTTGQWGYNPDVGTKSLQSLMEILLYTWGGDGNMLLNIGPRGDGSMNPVEVERLEQIAEWWQVNGETSIRSSRGGPYLPGPWGVSTRKSNKIYLHVFNWDDSEKIFLPSLKGFKVKDGKALTGAPVDIVQVDGGFNLVMKEADREKIVTTIELTMNKDVMDEKPIMARQSLIQKAKLTSSHTSGDLTKICDQDAETFWFAKVKDSKDGIWIEATFDEPVTVGSVVTGRGEEWFPKHSPELQIPDDNGNWKTVHKWKAKFEPVKRLKKPVTTDKIRLVIKNAPAYYIAEWELFEPM
ncbi:alpha-L-fucosidase [Carboxylicivirga marina]|uniref:alpha-L-fucosidase n=1 Tax=Carboxylicivirga marina TaxID=2800988 RepID=UPI0025982758|nr:alpha-L-fucosidase [uncultured Carboxylicivirga sp.]